MRKISIALLLLACVSCGGPSSAGDTNGSYEVITVQYQGKTIPCVVWDSAYAGGLDCGWE